MIIQWKWEIDLRDRSDRHSAWWTMDGGSWHCTADRDQYHPQEKEMQKSKWLSEEALQIAVKKRNMKSRGEKERYTHLNKMGKTRDLSQYQGLFLWVSSLHPGPKCWSFSISPSNEHSGLISFRIDWFALLAVQRDSQESSPAPQFKRINSSALSLLHDPALTSVHDYWKNHSFD